MDLKTAQEVFRPRTQVEIFKGEKRIDAGVILSVSGHGDHKAIPKLEYKSELNKIEGIIEFVTYEASPANEVEWFCLFRNPIEPDIKLFHRDCGAYKIVVV
jgi:hypothetical protein